MKQFFLGVMFALAVAAAAAIGIGLSGRVDVAADTPHHPLVFGTLEAVRDRAIERSARAIVVPSDLADSERVRRGAGNYQAMCVACHLKPGQTDSEIRKGLYPVPPNLSQPMTGGSAQNGDLPAAAEQFWVIKHGIKASGMAAWGRGGMTDANIWDLVAFIRAMPQMGPAEYLAWVAASDGHAHGDDHAAPHAHGEAEASAGGDHEHGDVGQAHSH